MESRWLRRTLGALAAALLIAAGWWFLAPAQLGGGTGYVVVKGNSMEPALREGDLVVTRRASGYAAGDVVLYEAQTLGGAPVLHRIVGAEGGTYTTRGDNRDKDDPDRFTSDAVRGALWFSVPAVGAPLDWLGRPIPLAALIFACVFVGLVGGRRVSRRRAGRASPPVHVTRVESSDGAVRPLAAVAGTVLVAALAATALFAIMAAVSWTRPATESVSVDGGYVHSGTFEYGADVRRSAVYPDGRVETGDAVFGEVADRVTFTFDYRFASVDRTSVRGGIALDAVVSDREGWTRSIPLAPAQPFEGGSARVEGVLDLRRVNLAVTRMRELTKTGEANFEVAITPRVQVVGYAGSTVIDTTYEPALPFSWDGYALRPDTAGAETSPFEPRLEGTTTATRDTDVGFGAVSLPTSEARALAALGIAVGLLVAAVCLAVLATRRSAGVVDVLRLRHGDRIVEAEIVIPEGRWISDVRSAESLGAIAEHYDRVILHTVEHGQDVYVVDDGVAVYRYCARPVHVAAGQVTPAAST
jgi:signal peptidase